MLFSIIWGIFSSTETTRVKDNVVIISDVIGAKPTLSGLDCVWKKYLFVCTAFMLYEIRKKNVLKLTYFKFATFINFKCALYKDLLCVHKILQLVDTFCAFYIHLGPLYQNFNGA